MEIELRIDADNDYSNRIRQQRQYKCLVVAAALMFGILAISYAVMHSRDNDLAKSDEPEGAPQSQLFTFTLENLGEHSNETGTIFIETMPEWAPLGVDRFHDLVASDFFPGCHFFRVIPNFIVQFGINGDPKIQAQWERQIIEDDPVVASNERGTVTFATAGPKTRTTQLFINTEDNNPLDDQGFAPIGRVVRGMDFVDNINAQWGEKPDQQKITQFGNDYLDRNFPGLSQISSVKPSL